MSNAQAATVTENGVPSVSQEEHPSFKVFFYFYSSLLTLSHILSRSLLEILPTLQPMMG
jgi:hypothetical protein